MNPTTAPTTNHITAALTMSPNTVLMTSLTTAPTTNLTTQMMNHTTLVTIPTRILIMSLTSTSSLHLRVTHLTWQSKKRPELVSVWSACSWKISVKPWLISRSDTTIYELTNY